MRPPWYRRALFAPGWRLVAATLLMAAGNGIWGAEPQVNFSANQLNFPAQIQGTASASQLVLLANSSQTDLSISGITISGPGPQGIYLDTQASNACVNNNTFKSSSGLSTAISANSSGDLGFGNILNLLSSNLTAGTCGPPLP